MRLNELKDEIEIYKTFSDFTETHEAIAAHRIQNLRSSVVENRVFLTEISDLYSLVKSYYLQDLAQNKDAVGHKKGLLEALKHRLEPKLDPQKITFLKKNGRNVSILLSSNTGFYGGILKNLYDDFIKYITENNSDVIIVGQTGQEYFTQFQSKKTFKGKAIYFDLDDEKPLEDQLAAIIKYARDYVAIVVHYVQFFSVLTQIPYYSNIAGEMITTSPDEKLKPFVFEPSFEDILIFFETQILEAIFRQKVYEHQLARYGSKLVAMDDAVTSSRAETKKLERFGLRLKKQYLNKKQQEIVSAVLETI
jgi:F0F1-type ATP synthase gamma subunit